MENSSFLSKMADVLQRELAHRNDQSDDEEENVADLSCMSTVIIQFYISTCMKIYLMLIFHKVSIIVDSTKVNRLL